MIEHVDSTGFLDRSQVSRLELTGADRVRFLNGRITCDIAPLSAGEGIYGFLPQIKGRILADVKVIALEESLWLELPPGKGDEITDHLSKYILFDDVELRPLDRVPVSLVGSQALSALDAELPESPLAHISTRVLGIELQAVREFDAGPPGSPAPVLTLWISQGDAESLLGKLKDEGLRPLAPETWERLRVESGRPLFGQDYGENNFPQETGLGDAVSYTKGCYLGQEVIARIHYRGGVNKHLRGLRFEGDRGSEAGPQGKAVLEGDREAGKVTSFALSETLGTIGLAVLHKRVEPGTQVEIEGGGSAEVVELPF